MKEPIRDYPFLTYSTCEKTSQVIPFKTHLFRAMRFICLWVGMLALTLWSKYTFLMPTLPATTNEGSSSLDYLSYPPQLVEMAQDKPETVDFVKNYINHLNQPLPAPPISIDADYTPGEIPLFIQWDTRWGYDYYGDEFIAISGCGPTALSMVAVGLTGNTSLNPKVVADFSCANGYLIDDLGSSWDLMTTGAQTLGITGRKLPITTSALVTALHNGEPLIASMRPGDFTRSGHFIVLTGLTPDGKIIVHDPDSLIRSHKSWDSNVLLKQIKSLWAFTT